MLSQQQIAFYRENGYLVLEGHLTAGQLAPVRDALARLVAGAQGLAASDDVYDLEDSHRPDAPRVRRIKLPHRVDPAFDALMRSDAILGPVRDLVGPSLRLHTSKLNLKSAGYGAAVEWHQDWAFYPHSNDDILAVGVMLDDVGPENGPLLVLPGSHRGPILDHHADGRFCGAVDPAASGLDLADAVALTGPAGSISLHHVRLVHGSDLNRSARDRALLLYEITAADAWPIQGSLSQFGDLESYDSKLLCGEPTICPRMANVPVRLPKPGPEKGGSIYENQKGAGTRHFGIVEGTGKTTADAD
ncbi:MAG: phytanoyl-CoA dioxygenase family protein [Inquilinus sp.]|nr:phytanoyl-CoA dioxygenase family protein [Inquilinus sp.]